MTILSTKASVPAAVAAVAPKISIDAKTPLAAPKVRVFSIQLSHSTNSFALFDCLCVVGAQKGVPKEKKNGKLSDKVLTPNRSY